MTPAGSGRHCATCQKIVVDFTHKTDAEILAHLARAGSQACGRFRAAQLGRPLVSPATPSRWRSWLASVLALGGVLGASRAIAQEGSYLPSAGWAPAAASTLSASAAGKASAPAATPADSSAGSALITIRGVVLEGGRNAPLPGAIVLVKGTQLGTTTAMDGSFTLQVPSTGKAITLLVRSIGYENAEKRLPVKALGRTTYFELCVSAMVLGGIGYEPTPPPASSWLARLGRALWGQPAARA